MRQRLDGRTEATDILRRLAERTTRFDFSIWFWGDAIAFDGLLDAAELLEDAPTRAFVTQFFDRWLHRTPSWTDYLAPGAALLRLHETTGRRELLDRAIRLADWFNNEVPRGKTGLHYFRPDLPQFRSTVLVDSLYHVPPFFTRLAHITGDARYHDVALEMWHGHADALSIDRGPLLCHNFDVGSGRHRGYGWGRGNGWALLGLLDVLELLPATYPGRPRALQRFRELALAVLPLQDPSGFWRTLLADPEAYLESSTLGFYGATFTKAVRLGLLDDPFAAAAELAWQAMRSRIDDEGGLFGVSGVTWASNAPTEEVALYKSMPTEVNVWGQGCALRFAAERIRSTSGLGPARAAA
jgi:unsaturated rhamnogalacturonyl hydrolase